MFLLNRKSYFDNLVVQDNATDRVSCKITIKKLQLTQLLFITSEANTFHHKIIGLMGTRKGWSPWVGSRSDNDNSSYWLLLLICLHHIPSARVWRIDIFLFHSPLSAAISTPTPLSLILWSTHYINVFFYGALLHSPCITISKSSYWPSSYWLRLQIYIVFFLYRLSFY